MQQTAAILLRDERIEAWHFLPKDRMTRFYPRQKVEAGTVLTVDCKPVLCERGLHASVRAIDALGYAPGPIACRVRVWGDVVLGDDKLAGTHRECIAMVDATHVLHEFACNVAEAALLLAGVTDDRSWRAIEAKRAWMRGEIDDASLDVAREAAREAAEAAAEAASRAAYMAAYWAAAREAAREAAEAAAGAAAVTAAGATAWAAACDAARAAAWKATWDAARAEQSAVLEAMLLDAMGEHPRGGVRVG